MKSQKKCSDWTSAMVATVSALFEHLIEKVGQSDEFQIHIKVWKGADVDHIVTAAREFLSQEAQLIAAS
jgi:uncharacterized lipoprotein YmbA